MSPQSSRVDERTSASAKPTWQNAWECHDRESVQSRPGSPRLISTSSYDSYYLNLRLDLSKPGTLGDVFQGRSVDLDSVINHHRVR